MNNSDKHHERIAKMKFASVYHLYVEKVEKKVRTRAELDEVIKWLTGFDDKQLKEVINSQTTFE